MKRKNTILAIDDKITNLQLIKAMLSNQDINVDLIQDSCKVSSFLETNSPDLILLDIMMPELDGYEVCKLLKENEKTKDIPVIFLTALDNDKNIAKGFEAGAVDYIKKPFKHFELIARVKTQLALVNSTYELKKELKLRRETEKNLENSINLNLFTQKTKRIGTWEWDIKNDVLTLSDTAFHIFGIKKNSKSTISFREILKQVHPKDRKRLYFELVGALRHNIKISSSEFRVIKNGYAQTINQISEFISNSDNKFIKILGVVEDISKKKKTKAEAKEAKEKFQNIIQNLTDVYYRSNAEGNFIMLSPSALPTFGYTDMTELIGNPISKLYKNPIEREKLLTIIKKEGKINNFQTTIVKKDKSEITIEVSAKILLDEDGNYAGVDGIVRDISLRQATDNAQQY